MTKEQSRTMTCFFSGRIMSISLRWPSAEPHSYAHEGMYTPLHMQPAYSSWITSTTQARSAPLRHGPYAPEDTRAHMSQHRPNLSPHTFGRSTLPGLTHGRAFNSTKTRPPRGTPPLRRGFERLMARRSSTKDPPPRVHPALRGRHAPIWRCACATTDIN